MTPSSDPQNTAQNTAGEHPGELPSAWSALWRTVQLGYRAEPRLLTLSVTMTVATALPDALFALWLKLLADGVVDGARGAVIAAALGLGLSAAATWFLTLVFSRLQRRFRDRVAVALESHVAALQARVATIEHHERPAYLDRLSVLRNQVFTLDHMFLSLFTTIGWLVRLAITMVLLASIHPALLLLLVCALPTVVTATWRPAIERVVEERTAPHDRLARHLFVLGTTAAPGKEVRVANLGARLIALRRASWERWLRPNLQVRRASAAWHAVGWAVFGAGYGGAIVFVAAGLRATPGAVLLVLAAGARLSLYVSAAVAELGFLRGFWLDAARRLAWLEDYAAAQEEARDQEAPERLERGIRFDRVSFRYPGTERLVLEDVSLELPAGAVVAIVGENGAGKTTLVKLLCRLYSPSRGTIWLDDLDLGRLAHGAWRARLAGAFQDFFRFELRAQSSIGLGDLPRIDQDAAVTTAVERAGAEDVVSSLARGLDTQLGPTWEQGVEVSFGQWQKLALARGFMRDQPLLLVLDEPTAALDAETEHALFERYAAARAGRGAGRDRATAAGAITLLVSHRFSTVRMADLIVVLDGARVAEVGSHEQLMARQGQYAQLYSIQAASYR